MTEIINEIQKYVQIIGIVMTLVGALKVFEAYNDQNPGGVKSNMTLVIAGFGITAVAKVGFDYLKSLL